MGFETDMTSPVFRGSHLPNKDLSLSLFLSVSTYIYIYIYTHVYIYIYIHIMHSYRYGTYTQLCEDVHIIHIDATIIHTCWSPGGTACLALLV